MTTDEYTPLDPEAPMYCAKHPNEQTYLRCAKCGKPICARCRVSTPVGFRCFECANLATEITIASLSEHPSCQICGSRLLAPVFWSSGYVTSVLRKKRAKQSLDENEQKTLTRTRRSADLVIAYGRRAVMAQTVYGIGPQTASRVLSKMHESDEEFYKDLLEAKLQFIATRPYWNN